MASDLSSFLFILRVIKSELSGKKKSLLSNFSCKKNPLWTSIGDLRDYAYMKELTEYDIKKKRSKLGGVEGKKGKKFFTHTIGPY